eukprot:TRINITY_DN93186_c0_g1_i1.p1 TRINITY_DN93186_c0_g1~~TRINITY_DN93186_c0_g1_i1.p1  ORF type:complete len:536 (+),score=120.71 TRINITY_DN93186_c0_g1_i1:68-1675(+)
MAQETVQKVLFVFPLASGHLNPSLPMARMLSRQGHEVHFACYEQMREAIEDTGATFHSEVELEPECFEGKGNDQVEALTRLQEDLGMKDEPMLLAFVQLKILSAERQVHGMIRFMKKLQPTRVVYCSIMSFHAAWAAKALGIPSIGLLTTAGPGNARKFFERTCEDLNITLEQLDAKMHNFQPSKDAAERIRQMYGIFIGDIGLGKPIGHMPYAADSAVNLVTTSECFYDAMTPELEAAYQAEGVEWVGVGALLDEAGAKRAAGHKSGAQAESGKDHSTSKNDSSELLQSVRAAKAAGRPVIFASMGTVITGDFPNIGWHGRIQGDGGADVGLTGCQLCRAAWGAIFDTFGTCNSEDEDSPLIVVSVGPQPNALGELVAPSNAICLPEVPQVELLRAGVDLFLTHGGQNSFTEALANGVPLVVCPGFGDQEVNAQKAVDMKVGLKVDRPRTEVEMEVEEALRYRQEAADALREVCDNRSFAESAKCCAETLKHTGGVPRAVKLVLSAGAFKTSKIRPGMNVSPSAVTRTGARAGA